MTATQVVTNSDYNQAEPKKPPCPMWKKTTAVVLAVAAVALFAAMWLASPDSPTTATIAGLTMILAASLGLVLAGIALVAALAWIISRSAPFMRQGRAAVEYMVHCYPERLKNRILS